MKVLLVNGSPNKEGCTFTALSEVAGALQKHGIETEIFHIGRKPVHGCIACGRCEELGRCTFDDDICNELTGRMIAANGIIIGSPVYYAGPNGALCALLDRIFFSSSHKFSNKPAAAVVSCRRGGATAAFDRLNKYFTISRMPVVSSQYWNMVHGFTPDDVRKDLEGLQIMRTLGDNMAWMLKSIKTANQMMPEKEPWVMTNFIR
ncbi:MAG: flavodoxin family protein [Bacillota bacterium]|jgi:multimeric flavodoxin WrbA|nr:flavodoxin family protein [Bacillota bacterium]